MFEKWNTFVKIYFDFHYETAGILWGFLLGLYIVFRRKEGKNITGKQILGGGIFAMYFVLILGVTLLNRTIKDSYRMELMPFWSYRETFCNGNKALGIQILQNILAFIPWGILVPLLFERFRRFKHTVLSAAVLSGAIEILQLVFRCGLCELDDVMNNVLGTIIGYAIWRVAVLRGKTLGFEKTDRKILNTGCEISSESGRGDS